jgi:ABC-type transport system involved in multi-copper enzyme maturation permease subunit
MTTSTLKVCRALIRAGFLETLRRRELYVLGVLTALLVFGAYSFAFFGVTGLDIFVKDMAFTAVGLFSTILGVAIATRQIPEELSRRTIYPLLARPITRGQLLLGKFLTAWCMSLLCFGIMTAIAVAVLLVLRLPLKPIFFQYLYLKGLGLFWLCAFCTCLSVSLSPSAAFTLGLLLTIGSGAFTRTLLLTFGSGSAALNWLIATLYGFLPHYALFDTTSKLVYGWNPIPIGVVLALTVYSLASGAFWLWLAWLRFRRQAL